ncbi:MAG: hypothetical protein ABL899_01440, partial [Nitrospira sp.]
TVLIPITAILFIFREVVFQSKIFSHLDVLITFIPYYDFLSHGTGLITPSILSGFPVFVSTNSGWFNPINKLFFHFLDSVDTFRLLDVSYLILAYSFSYLFMRRIKVGHLASILGATIFIFAGQVMLWSETIIITNYYFLMPLALYIVDVAIGSKLIKAFFLYILLGLLFGWGFLSGHVQFLIYVYTLVGCYFLFLLWHKYKEEHSYTKTLFHIGFFVLTFVISYFVGLPSIRAILDFLPFTARASGVSLSAATGYAYVPWHLLYYILPSLKIPYLPVSQSFQNYIGLLPLFIFSLTFLLWRDLNQNKYFNFFFGVFTFCFIASVKYSPVAFIMHQLPFYSSFRETFRVMFIGDFALGIVVAIATGVLWESREAIYPKIENYLKWIKRAFVWVVLPVVTFVSILKIFFFTTIGDFLKNYFLTHLYSKTVGGFPPDHYYRIIDSYLHQSIDQFYIFNSGVTILFIFGISSYFLVKNIKTFPSKHFLFLAIVITTLNFSTLYAFRIQGIPKLELLTPPKTAEFIKAREIDGEPFRVFSPLMDITMFNETTRCNFPDLGNWDASYQDFSLRRELIEPDLPILYGLESADGYEPYVTTRVSDVIGYVGSRSPTTDNHSISSEKISLDKKIALLVERKNIYRALNVKYLLTLFPISDSDFTLVYKDEIGECKSKLFIYELKNPYPRYFLTDRVVPVSPTESFVSQMEKLSLYDTPTVLLESKMKDIGNISNKRYIQSVIPNINDGDKREFIVDVMKDSYFFIGEALLPGFVATVDDKPVTLLRANYIYSAIPISFGKHTVKLEYKK